MRRVNRAMASHMMLPLRRTALTGSQKPTHSYSHTAQFSFDPNTNKGPPPDWAIEKQNATTSFDEAIKPLIPLEQLKPKLINL
jgi:hypothetical protein